MNTNDPHAGPEHGSTRDPGRPYMKPNDPPLHPPDPPVVEFLRPGYYVQPSQATNGLAVAALVLGIVWIFWLGSALAIVFGHVALGQIRRRNQSGKGMAVAGLVLGYVGAGTFALFVVLPLLLGTGA